MLRSPLRAEVTEIHFGRNLLSPQPISPLGWSRTWTRVWMTNTFAPSSIQIIFSCKRYQTLLEQCAVSSPERLQDLGSISPPRKKRTLILLTKRYELPCVSIWKIFFPSAASICKLRTPPTINTYWRLTILSIVDSARKLILPPPRRGHS